MAWGCVTLVAIIILGSPVLLLLRFLATPSVSSGAAWVAATLLSLGFLVLLRRYKRVIEQRIAHRD